MAWRYACGFSESWNNFYAPRRISGEHIVAASSVRPSRSCPRKFSETACRISMKLHGNIKYQRWMRISPACSGSMIFPRVIALWWVLHEYIGYCWCPREFSETTSRISLKLHGNIKYGRWMCISPACSGSMIFPRVIALWWVLHEYIGYCSCPRKFLANTGRNSTKFLSSNRGCAYCSIFLVRWFVTESCYFV